MSACVRLSPFALFLLGLAGSRFGSTVMLGGLALGVCWGLPDPRSGCG
jgi:hypothetical protein